MLLDREVHGDIAVFRRIDVDRHTIVAGIAGAQWGLAGAPIGFELRGQRRIGGFLHRHFHQPPDPGHRALVERGHRRRVEVDAGEKIDNRRPRLERRPAGLAGDADDPGKRLDRQVHRQIVAIGPAQPIAGARGINQPRVDRVQHREPDAEPVHHPRREILQQHVGFPGHAEQQLLAALVLEVEGDRPLVRIEHRDGERRRFAGRRAAAQRLTVKAASILMTSAPMPSPSTAARSHKAP